MEPSAESGLTSDRTGSTSFRSRRNALKAFGAGGLVLGIPFSGVLFGKNEDEKVTTGRGDAPLIVEQ